MRAGVGVLDVAMATRRVVVVVGVCAKVLVPGRLEHRWSAHVLYQYYGRSTVGGEFRQRECLCMSAGASVFSIKMALCVSGQCFGCVGEVLV